MCCSNDVKTKKVMMVGLDGADPMLIKRFIDEGKLPNFKKMIEMGVATEDLGMQGVLPTITPPNWASLATGAYPNTHGITCFWNHELGKPLDELEYGWDSNLCKAEYIWDAFERAGKKSILMNYPTSWPPTTKNSIVIDGTSIFTNLRGYTDYEKYFTCAEGDFAIEEVPHVVDNSGTDCRVETEVTTQQAKIKPLDGFGYSQPGLVTEEGGSEEEADAAKCDKVRTPIKAATGWENAPEGAKEVVLPVNSGNTRRFGLLIASDGKTYDTFRIYVSKNDEQPIGEAKVGCWSEFIYDTYNMNGENRPVAYKIKVTKMQADGSYMEFYYSFVQDIKNDKYFYPKEVCSDLFENVGPMLQPSNYDRHNVTADTIVIESMADYYSWHEKAISYLLDNKEWDLFYSHIHGIDMLAHYYLDYNLEQVTPDYKRYRALTSKIYQITDHYIGELLKRVGDDVAMIVVSDHAAITPGMKVSECPLIGDMWGMNVGVMSELGYTKLKEVDGNLEIDWANTKAVAQRAMYIYINLKGRDPQGIVDPEDYDELVKQIISDLYTYRDPKTGRRVISFALNRHDMEDIGLGGPHCGDIVYFMENEFCRTHGNGLSNQTFYGFSTRCLLLMAGDGFKKGEVLRRRCKVVDVVPTICHIAGAPMPRDIEGSVIYQALESFED
ncbi:alkaline phosphatase family protein [Candidatus Formimonas warabiya]|uniref:Nucleotide pyrophosphatase n=1 Tax=Formimonas warabiya TaxID=1761012 RepID=A0A3G1KYA8_FORW1|nr:alkaline phosphatase family protein [Candidatus Formimonas warabiya]ATW27377.1 nucleotide pyrophosphatase [Candidatus Formimonas warabiya]